MSVTRQQLILLALCALDEIAEQARHRRIAPSFALRFVLAFLWSRSDRRDRSDYDAIWRNLVAYTVKANQAAPTAGDAVRYGSARAQFTGIARSLGLEEERLRERINRARGRPADYRPVEKLWGAMSDAERRAHARKVRHCEVTRLDQPFGKPPEG